MVFSPFQFFDRFVDGFKRRNYGPSHSATRFGTCLREESVVSAAQGDVQGGVIRKINEEQRRKDYLGFHVEFVHVLKPGRNVGHSPASLVTFSTGFRQRRRRPSSAPTSSATG